MEAIESRLSQLLLRKLEQRGKLTDVDRGAVRALPFLVRSTDRHRYILRKGEPVTHCHLLIEGFAFGHRERANGARQIVSLHLPGDFLNLHDMFSEKADHNVGSITSTKVASVEIGFFRGVSRSHPNVAEALWADCLIDAAIAREWLVNVGRRTAVKRVAHTLCELAARCEMAGLGTSDGFFVPMTLQQIGDATGLTSVHVSRTMRQLRSRGLIAKDAGRIRIIDWAQITALVGFDGRYLHANARVGA